MLNKIALVVSVAVLTIFYYYIYALNSGYEKENFFRELDNSLLFAKNLFEEEQRYALAISTLISQDSDFLNAYYSDDRKKAFEIINEKIKNLSHIEGSKIEAQVHDKDANTYLRSWKYEITNIPLSEFRKGVVYVKESKKKVVSVEVGERLNIKAISPIFKNGEFDGSIEVIVGFDHLQNKLSMQGYTMFILLDKKYLDIAHTLQSNTLVAKDFILVNNPQDFEALNSLKNSDLSSLGDYGYFQNKNISYGYFRLKNLHNEHIGYCVLALRKQSDTLFKKHYKESTGEQNSKGVVIRWKYYCLKMR